MLLALPFAWALFSFAGASQPQDKSRRSAPVSPDGTCGNVGSNQYDCRGSGYGDCCSLSDFCGSTEAYCGPGCQVDFGSCSATYNISSDGHCGANGKTCTGSQFGSCCSSSNFCGDDNRFCNAGCQSGFGSCNAGYENVSSDGVCGMANGKTCLGSTFGDCCSSSGFCGSTAKYCAAGCNSDFGACAPGAASISTDGNCGSSNNKTCVGSGDKGNCCSKDGHCGRDGSYCGQGCQTKFSSGCLTTNIPSNDGSCGSKNGLTCKNGPFDGQCCSADGQCGTTAQHCGSGCQKDYGMCS